MTKYQLELEIKGVPDLASWNRTFDTMTEASMVGELLKGHAFPITGYRVHAQESE